MRRRLQIALLSWLVFATTSWGCMNDSSGLDEELYHAEQLAESHQSALRDGSAFWAFNRHILKLDQMPVDKRPVYFDQELKSLELMQAGDYLGAIEILLAIEAEHPDSYVVATNLDTLYELTGQNEKALTWIREGIARNPDSHEGTEWLHVLILDYKIALAQDPNFLRTHPILAIPDSFSAEDVVDVGGASRTINEIRHALNYQLRERLVFIKDNDPIMGDLLAAHAKIMASLYYPDTGVIYYDMAKRFGPTFPEAIAEQRSELWDAMERRKFMRSFWLALRWGGGILAIVGMLYIAWRRRWFFLSSVDYERHLAAKRRERLTRKSAAVEAD